MDLGILSGKPLMRKLCRFLLILVTVSLLSGIPVKNARAVEDDFQLWNSLSFTHPFKDSKFSLYWVAENRLQNDASDFLFFYTAIGFFYSPYSWFRLGPFYRVQKRAGQPVQQVPYPEFDFFASLGPIDIFDRNLFQFFISSDDFTFQYRNLFQISHVFKLGSLQLIPFAFDEVFFGSGGSPLSQNRVGGGNGFGFLNGKVIFDLYYLLQTVHVDSVSMFENRHVLGTRVKLRF